MQIVDWDGAHNTRIAELEKECFEYPWSHEMVEETAGLSNFCGVVALNESGEVFGYAGAICAFDSADIALVAVEKEYRRQGAGYSMLKVLLKKLEKIGVIAVFLEVRVSNESAKKLYKKAGFSPVGIRKKYYENGEDALVMVRELPFEL